MTNKEIREEFNVENVFPDSQKQVLNSYFNSIQDLTRKDERERVLQEIQQRFHTLIPLPNNEFGGKLGAIMLVIAKELNALKK